MEQQFFRMDGVLAWTASLVIFVLIIQKIIELLERRLLRYRPSGATPQVSEAAEQQQPEGADQTESDVTPVGSGRNG